jgi:hypothetical protein
MLFARPIPGTPADELYGKMTVAAVVFAVVFEIGYFVNTHPPFDALGYLIGRDFVNSWMGARASVAGNPAAWFDFEAYNVALRALFGAAFPEHNWSYPPHLLLFTWPLSFLPYLPAYAAWCALGYAAYLLVTCAGEKRPSRILMFALAPAVLVNIFAGQNGFFTAALMIGALKLMDRRPVAAGILFALLTIKPQLGLLVPLMLVLTARWRCLFAAAAATLALASIAALVFGVSVWTDYVKVAMPMQQIVLTHGSGIFPAMMPTAFMNARIAHLPLEWCWAVQGVVSALAVAAVVWTFWKRRDPVLSLALFVTASFLVTPYAFNYDMVVFTWVIMLVRDHEGSTMKDHRLALAVWTLPVTTILLGLANIPVSSLVLMAFAARLIWRLAHEYAPETKHTASAMPASASA